MVFLSWSEAIDLADDLADVLGGVAGEAEPGEGVGIVADGPDLIFLGERLGSGEERGDGGIAAASGLILIDSGADGARHAG